METGDGRPEKGWGIRELGYWEIFIVFGLLIYLVGNVKNFRTDDSFIGGEKFQDKTGFGVVEFYKTIANFSWLAAIYKSAQKKSFDLYDQFKNIIIWCSKGFSKLHNGILSNYAIWILAGLIIMLIFLI